MHLLFGVFTVVKISSVPEHGCSVRSREGCLWGEAEDLKWDCLSVDSVSVIGWLLGPRLSSSCRSSHLPQANWSLTLKAKLFYCRVTEGEGLTGMQLHSQMQCNALNRDWISHFLSL